MRISKPERLTNLVIGLLATRRFVTAERIRRTFAGYQECRTQDAFERMFERDKAELRDLGIPLETGTAYQDDEIGYRINRSEYELPPITLSPQESAAVAVASRLWRTPEMSAASSGALMKLRAAGIPVDDSEVATVLGGIGGGPGAEPVVAALVAALDVGQAVQFRHLAASTGTRSLRTVEPWGVSTCRGNWYLVGFDRDREASRTFRLSRIDSDITRIGPENAVHVPESADPRALVAAAAQQPTSAGSATLWLADGHAYDLRRIGTVREHRPLAGRDGAVLDIPIGLRAATVRTIAGHGPNAVVLAPTDLRSEVLTALDRASAAHSVGPGRQAAAEPGAGEGNE